MEPFSSACRLCLWKGDKMIDVFRCNQKYNILDKIHKCIPIKFQKSDVTHVICHNCYYKLEIFAEFLTVCSRSDAILKRYVESQNMSSNDESSEYPALKVVTILDSSDDGMTEDEEASVNKRRLEKSKTSANTAIKRDLSRLPETNDLSAAFKNAVSAGHLIEKPVTTNEQPKQLQKPVKPKSAQVAPDQTVNKVQPTVQATEPAKQVSKPPPKVKRQASEVQAQDRHTVAQDKQTVAQDKQTVAQDKQNVNQDKPPAAQPTATVKHVATPEKHDPVPDKQVAPQKKPPVAQDKQIPVQSKASTVVEKQVTTQKKQSAVQDKQVPAPNKQTSPDKPVTVQDKQLSPQKKQAVGQDREVIVEKQTPVQTSADKQATTPNKQVPVKKQAVAQDKPVTVTEKPVSAQDKQASPQKKQAAAQDKQVSPEKQVMSPEKQVTPQSKQISAHDNETVGKDKREGVAEKQQRSQWKEAHDKQVAEELKNLLEQEKAVAALLSSKPKVASPTTRNSPRLYNEYTRHETMVNGIAPCPDTTSDILTGRLRSGLTRFQCRRSIGGPKTNGSFLNAVTDVGSTGILSNVVRNGSDGSKRTADVLEVRDTGTFTVVVKNVGSVASNRTSEDVDTGSTASDVARRSSACDDRWLNSLETLGGKVPLVRLNRVNVCLTCGSVFLSQDVLDRHVASSACTRKRKRRYSEKKFTRGKGLKQSKRTKSSCWSSVMDNLSPERPAPVLTVLESLGLVKKSTQDGD